MMMKLGMRVVAVRGPMKRMNNNLNQFLAYRSAQIYSIDLNATYLLKKGMTSNIRGVNCLVAGLNDGLEM
jgi:hypothetical protein